jgi:DNA-damage-inducible protein J
MRALSAKVRDDEAALFMQIAEQIGTTPSNAIRMFVSAFNRRGGFPFDVSNPYGFNKETLQAMEATAQGVGLSRTFTSADAMLADLDA